MPRTKRLILHIILQLLLKNYNQGFHNFHRAWWIRIVILQLLLNITHPLSTLKSIYYLWYSSYVPNKRNLYHISHQIQPSALSMPPHWCKLLYWKWSQCAEFWSSRFQGSMGPESLGWCYLVLDSTVHWFQYAAWILTCFMWEKCGKACPRFVLHPFFPAFSRTQLHQFLTLSPSSAQCLLCILSCSHSANRIYQPSMLLLKWTHTEAATSF